MTHGKHARIPEKDAPKAQTSDARSNGTRNGGSRDRNGFGNPGNFDSSNGTGTFDKTPGGSQEQQRDEGGTSLPHIMVNGLCMALADSVPGVSGGTIAFIMGFYEKLLKSVDELFRGKNGQRREGVIYLVKLGMGWIVGMLFSLTVLSNVLDTGIYVLSSAFLGLTIAAIPLIVHEERDVMRGHAGLLMNVVIGAVIVAGLMMLRQASSTGLALDFAAMDVWQYVYVFIAGAVAVSAMILPGISGSSLLLIFGVYAPFVAAFHQLTHMQLAVVPGLIALVAGIVCGLAVSVGIVRRLLREHRSGMMYLIIGLMVGSLYAIVMGPATMANAQPPLSLGTFNIIGFAVGIAIIVVLELVKRKRAAALQSKK